MTLEKAARQIVLARDYHAERLAYPAPPLGPDPDQCFDDWASDLLDAALTSETTLRDMEGLLREVQHTVDSAVDAVEALINADKDRGGAR